LAAQVADLVWPGEFRQLGERFAQDNLITRAVVRRPEGTAHRVIDERGSRWGDFAHDVMGGADHQRGYAVAFENMGDETDGLMTKGSVGNQQRKIDLSLLQVIGDRRRQIIFDLLGPAHAAHKRIMKRCDCADGSVINQSRQRRTWKNRLGVLLGNPADARMMVDNDLARTGI